MGLQSPIPSKDTDTELSELEHVVEAQQKKTSPPPSFHALDAPDVQPEPQAASLGEECAGVASHDHTSSIKPNPESMYGVDHQVVHSGGWAPQDGSRSPARSDTSVDSLDVNLGKPTPKEARDRGRAGRSKNAARARGARHHGQPRKPSSPAGRAQEHAETHGVSDRIGYPYPSECSLSGDEQGPPNNS